MVHKHTQPTNIKKIQKYTSTQEEHIEKKEKRKFKSTPNSRPLESFTKLPKKKHSAATTTLVAEQTRDCVPVEF